ncbi:MAG: twin-arginine translocase subunit TatC [Gammaproteobacteria bacterium]|nr:twin-arginine translocase subunit TatC [Gammaproteobacteria bacterium]
MTNNKASSAEQDSDIDEGAETLIGHLIELRSRVLKTIVFILLVFCSLVYFANDIYEFVSLPLRQLLPEGSTMIATGITSPFFAPFKLTMVLSLMIAVPLILHQLWSFISPGLYQHEKKIARPLLLSSIILFYTGVAFAYYVAFPLMLTFFTTIGPSGVELMPDISQFLDIALKLFFAFGIAFEVPIATFLLIVSGVTSIESLRDKRAYVIVGCFVFGMLLTPPDIISQTLLALPMWILFELGIIFAGLVQTTESPESE